MRVFGANGRSLPGTGLLAAAALAAAAAMIPADAGAAAQPTVSTGGVHEVGYATAVLTGTVNPNGKDASYYFQYGPTRAYGGQTAIADAGSGGHTGKGRVPPTGAPPITD